jgi:uncharacterized protein YheU (UPF0270 family)
VSETGKRSPPSAGEEGCGAPDKPSVVEIPPARLSQAALDGLIEEFVTRDGTDYGPHEHSLEEKKSALARQLERGEVVIVFDAQSETCNIVPKDAVG